MFLRQNNRRKNGKLHRYFSVVENRRTATGTTQRQVLYLGEINDSQQESWRRTLRVFDEDRRQYCELSLFPDDRPLPPEAVGVISVKLDQMQLRRPRSFGDCWLGCWLWDRLQLSSFWNQALSDGRGDVPWTKVLQLLVVNRLIDPGSELRLHRQWFLRSAMDELLGVDYAAAGKDRLYRCLDRILAHKEALCQGVAQQWKTLFDTSFDVLLYDLTSTYFEGLCAEIPKAKHGYNRDGRGDCRQVVIALVVTPDGLPLAYEVLAGNTTDKTTLRGFLAKIEQLYGKARRTWVMDRGIPTEATLKEMREAGTQYLVGTPRSMLGKLDQQFADQPWQQVHEAMTVKLAQHEGGVLCAGPQRSAPAEGEGHAPPALQGVRSRAPRLAPPLPAGPARPDQTRHSVGAFGGIQTGGGTDGRGGDRPCPQRRPDSHAPELSLRAQRRGLSRGAGSRWLLYSA